MARWKISPPATLWLAQAASLLMVPPLLCSLCAISTATAAGADKAVFPSAPTPTQPEDFRSKNFLIHTDLSADEAKELLAKMEKMLSLISSYWGRPNQQTIECYVVKEMQNWPRGSLHPRGIEIIRQGGGVTLTRKRTSGSNFIAKSAVYAVADRGTPLHEAVHAYCEQTFGSTGPTWYSEGMAEMGHYWRDNDPSVNCPPIVAEYLRTNEPKSLNGIVNGRESTGDSWQNYAWRWALCHLLANNTNYRSRFRPLGLRLLTNRPATFKQVYGSMAQEISFEYLFFLQHVKPGYRVDLCSWDWKMKFRRPTRGKTLTTKIKSDAGWQPSRLLLKKDEEYEFSATGEWQTGNNREATTADGSTDGIGKLTGAVFHDYRLSEPFEMGTHGSFTAPDNGNLVLRCRDAWHEIADNTGAITVKLKIKGAGKPLANPLDANKSAGR